MIQDPLTHWLFEVKSISVVCLLSLFLFIMGGCSPAPDARPVQTEYGQLVSLFEEWRAFEAPAVTNGVPDYSPDAMTTQRRDLASWKERLAAFDTTDWSIPHQVDWYLVRAEMNGLDFSHRVKRPWQRDPAFYVWFYPSPTDVPAREGPVVHGAIELSAFEQPLSAEDAAGIATRLRKAPAIFAEARDNLTGNARDLWITGIRSIREQSSALDAFADRVEESHPDLAAAAREARAASDDFALWLSEQADSKTGASGTGKENYSWNLKNVHLIPYTWKEEEVLLKSELARAHASLRLEEHRNRKRPDHTKMATPEEYDRRMNAAVDEYMAFLSDEEILTMRDYMEPALRSRVGAFSPVEEGELRGFFSEMTYRGPIVMRTHDYHWIELARMREEPNLSPIRRQPSLFNIWDARSEGMATAMEEMMMLAGLLDEKPRVRELIWVLLAERCARGLGALYQHGLDMSLEEATQFASRWTPWGVLPADGETIQHEEQFYLRQPAYGTSYVIGKIGIEMLLAEKARQQEGSFELKAFMDDFNRTGAIPVSLMVWEMTGDKSMLLEAVGE